MTDAYEWNRFVAQDSDACGAMAASAAEKAATLEYGGPQAKRLALSWRLHERYYKAAARKIRELRIPKVDHEPAPAHHR